MQHRTALLLKKWLPRRIGCGLSRPQPITRVRLLFKSECVPILQLFRVLLVSFNQGRVTLLGREGQSPPPLYHRTPSRRPRASLPTWLPRPTLMTAGDAGDDTELWEFERAPLFKIILFSLKNWVANTELFLTQLRPRSDTSLWPKRLINWTCVSRSQYRPI